MEPGGPAERGRRRRRGLALRPLAPASRRLPVGPERRTLRLVKAPGPAPLDLRPRDRLAVEHFHAEVIANDHAKLRLFRRGILPDVNQGRKISYMSANRRTE